MNALYMGNPSRKRRNPNACTFEHIAGTGVTVITNAASGDTFLVDTADASRIGWVSWSSNSAGYAQCRSGKCPLLHRVVLGYSGPEEVDHINGDRTDNRRDNLRVATKAQNTSNKAAIVAHGFKGVVFMPNGRYKAQITAQRKTHYLGIFETPEEAHAAYVAAANQHFGEYARAA